MGLTRAGDVVLPVFALVDGKNKTSIYTRPIKFAADKNEKVIPFIGKQLEVKGVVTEKDGKKMIDISSIAEAKK